MSNWLMELTKLSKTDETAKGLLAQLKRASTDEEKEKAKQNGKAYIEAKSEKETSTTETTENTDLPISQESDTTETQTDPEKTDEDTDAKDSDVDSGTNLERGPVAEKVVDKKFDMSEPAFNPRLAKMGITREEELFKLGVYVRKLSRDEKILIRRSIYQKTKGYRAQTQETFKKKQAEARIAREADPEYQKLKRQQVYVLKIEEALKNHYNIDWMLKNIEGLTVEVVRELLKKPENVNRFTTQKEEFVKNFYKRFSLTSDKES